jgi:hypothetical protein
MSTDEHAHGEQRQAEIQRDVRVRRGCPALSMTEWMCSTPTVAARQRAPSCTCSDERCTNRRLAYVADNCACVRACRQIPTGKRRITECVRMMCACRTSAHDDRERMRRIMIQVARVVVNRACMSKSMSMEERPHGSGDRCWVHGQTDAMDAAVAEAAECMGCPGLHCMVLRDAGACTYLRSYSDFSGDSASVWCSLSGALFDQHVSSQQLSSLTNESLTWSWLSSCSADVPAAAPAGPPLAEAANLEIWFVEKATLNMLESPDDLHRQQSW